jgi:arsenite oxidase large subunit
MNPDDAKAGGVNAGDVVEVFNDYGSTYAMAYPTKAIKAGQTFMLFGYFNGIAGHVTSDWTDRNIIPYYKGAWASIRRVGSLEDYKATVSHLQLGQLPVEVKRGMDDQGWRGHHGQVSSGTRRARQ